jgi:MFS transporter, OFA family, oxalate/formate antiporter
MSDPSFGDGSAGTRSKFSYGWIIVAACTLMIAVTYGLIYSYSVFFKPLAVYFGWDRATVSLIYSLSFIIRGSCAIGIGWLADRYGATRVAIFCGFMIGLGLALSSQVHTLWQFVLTYALVEAVGLSGAFGIGTALVARWFTKKRGLALGIIASGSGLGTLLIVPGNERLVAAFDWPRAFIICGVAAAVIMISAAFLLRSPPSRPESPLPRRPVEKTGASHNPLPPPADISLGQAIKDSRMLLMMGATLTFFFGIQIVAVHLVNYATDMGISPLVAASFVSVIGVISIAGRLSTGAGTDKLGVLNTMVLTRVCLAIAFIFLIFTGPLWSFYLFAVIYGLPYGGEVTQIPLFIGKYFGTKAMATLVGLNLFITSLGGALGP